MKKCRRCSKPATYHIVDIQHGDANETHLCEQCAHQFLATSDSAVDTVDTTDDEPDQLTSHLLADISEEELADLDNLVCPNCAITFKQFRSQGRLGCPHDYIAFEAQLIPLLENIHGETQHVGKLPKSTPDAGQRHYHLIKLRNDLRSAVEQEAYEDAARLRDEIHTLEVEIGESDGGSESLL